MKHAYYTVHEYLQAKYHTKMRKICVDGGFSCPNRDGTCGTGGCVFCGARGAGEHLQPDCSIREQVTEGLQRAKADTQWILYFQNFTNTYAPVDVLRQRYDAALIDPRIRVLDIGTRPDCITEEIADLLASYQPKYDVWVELGLQTANEQTARRIRRGYDNACFTHAVELLKSRHLPIIAHMIIGLPDETQADIRQTIAFLNASGVDGVKIHSLYVMRDTTLETWYQEGTFQPISMQTYVQWAIDAVTRLAPHIVIHRLTGNCPRASLVAPSWILQRDLILYTIDCQMRTHALSQGCCYDAANGQAVPHGTIVFS